MKKVFPDTESRKIIEGKEVDIYIPSKNLGIEYNGYRWHKEVNNKHQLDEEKISFLNMRGIKTLIINEIKGKKNQIENKTDIIYFTIKSATHYKSFLPNLIQSIFKSLEIILDVDIDVPLIDIKRDGAEIYKNVSKICSTGNSIIDKATDQIKEKLQYWDYKRNTITPEMVSLYSSTIVYWHCSICGKSFTKSVERALASGSKSVCCPECGEKLWAHKTTEVINLTTGELFPSISKASLKYAKDRKTGKPSLNGAITSACINKTVRYGCRWMYTKDYEKITGKQYNPPSDSAIKLDPELLNYWDYDKNLPEIPANLTENTHYWLIDGNPVKCSIESLQKHLKKLAS